DTFITEYANNYNIKFNNIFLEAIPKLNNCNINNLMNKYMQWNNKPTEDIFYKILLMMYKYKESIKYYILILNKIDIESMYENRDDEYDNMNNKAYLKRLVYLTTLISKNVSNRSKVMEVLQRLMDLDDGEPINNEDVERVKNDIKE
ncbi:Condensin-like protein, partial [Spraguea lophii 42_110]